MCSRYDGQFSNGNGNAATIDCMDRPTMRQRDISQRSHSGAKANDENGKSTQFNTDRKWERERTGLFNTHSVFRRYIHISILYIGQSHRRRERKTSLRFENNSEAKKTSDAVHKLICVILQCNE